MPSFTFYATRRGDRRDRRRAGVLRHRPGHDVRHAPRRSRPRSPTRTTAIVPVHLFGNVAPVDEIERARPAGAGGRRAGAGAKRDGAAPARSATPRRSRSSRPRTCRCLGDGGAIVTDDDEVAATARGRLRFHGSEDKGTFTEVGYNSRLDELQAARAADAAARARRLERDAPRAAARGVRGGGARRARASYRTTRRRRRARLPPLRGPPPDADALGDRAHRRGIGARGYYRTPGAPPAGDGGSDERCELPGTDEAARTHLALPMGTELDSGRRSSEVVRGVRVWVDLTNAPHVLVMRPLIDAHARPTGHEVEVTARDFAQTLQLLRALSAWTTPRSAATAAAGWPTRRVGLSQRSRRARALGARARLRRRDGPRLERRDRRRQAAAASRARPRSTTSGRRSSTPSTAGWRARGGARRDPAGAPPPLRRAREAAPLRGPEGGVLPRRLRARRGGARRAGPRRAPQPLVVVRTPPEVSLYHRFENDAVRAACSSGCEDDADGGAAAHAPSSARSSRAAGGFIVPEQADRRAEPGRLRRPRGLRRRYDEPRGGRARHARLHHVRGPAGGGRRAAAARRGGCASWTDPDRDRGGEALRRRLPSACAGTRASSRSCCSAA